MSGESERQPALDAVAGDGRLPPDAGPPPDAALQAVPLLEYGLIAVIAVVVAFLALTVFADQVASVLSVIGSEIDRAT